jgi:hypothetical protein
MAQISSVRLMWHRSGEYFDQEIAGPRARADPTGS